MVSTSYRPEVGAILEVLAEGLAPFVDRRMKGHFGDDDWIVAAATKLGKREPVLASPTDPQFQLEVMVRWWGPVFASSLSKETRERVQELRKARNDWAHIDDAHPIDLEYARRIHQLAEDLLGEIGSPLIDRVGLLAENLERAGARQLAEEQGISEAEALIRQLAELQAERESLNSQLAAAQRDAQTATGRQRAVARQLAELQAQYAAVSGLRERYRALQEQLAEAQQQASDTPDSETLAAIEQTRQQLATAERAVTQLQAESARLHEELRATQHRLETIDPVDTPAGRRWIWLVSALIVTMALAIAALASQMQGGA